MDMGSLSRPHPVRPRQRLALRHSSTVYEGEHMKESMRVRVDTADGGGDEHTLDVDRTMTVIVHPGMMEITALDDDVMTITAENTVARTRQLTLQQWDELRVAPGFVMLFK